MKIVVDARTLGSKPSGIGMYLYDFLVALGKNPKYQWILITDVATSEYIVKCKKMGIKVISYGKPVSLSRSVFTYFDFIQKKLNEIKPDLFWEVNALMAKSLTGNFKTLITLHDMFPITHPADVGRLYGLYFKFFLMKTLKNTDYILYNSKETRKETIKCFPNVRNIPSQVSYIIANGDKKNTTISDGNYFLYLGNMERRKGVDILLRAYERYRSLGGDKPLILAGKMQEKGTEKLLQEIMKTTPGIEYKNYVGNEERDRLYANCSCFVFPSRAEGFGMPVVEVMKYGKPIIASNLSIFDELVGDSINRFSINAGNKGMIYSLTQQLFDYEEEVDYEAYAEILSKYSSDVLSARMEAFLDKIQGDL